MYKIQIRIYELDPESDVVGKQLRLMPENAQVLSDLINEVNWAVYDSHWEKGGDPWTADDIDLEDVTDEDIKTVLGYYPVVGTALIAKTLGAELWLRMNTPTCATILIDE